MVDLTQRQRFIGYFRDGNAVAGDVMIFSLATAGTYLAQSWERPISAVLIYLVGVMAIGARSGLTWGLAAALSASLVYNFFLSEPVFSFSTPSADEWIPLIAFNASAILSGAMAGRLKDSVKLARSAEEKSAHLLRLSDELQRAITVDDVARIARRSLPFGRLLDLEITLARDVDMSTAMIDPALPDTGFRILPLIGAEGIIGTVRFELDRRPNIPIILPDLQGIAIILGLAIDRCQLLERLSESAALQKSEELKTAILSSVSHDLRTPLTAIEAAATSLRSFDKSLTPSDREKMLDTISQQCRKLNRYTANLLDMGRIQAGIPDFLFIEVDVIEILGVVLGAIREAYPGQEIEKQIQLDTAVVKANPAMLEQVIFNLIENAILHGASIRPIYVVITSAAGNCVLEIVDFGPGITLDEQPLVFNKFYRSRTSAHREGNGLGLHIANGFAEAFGGTIRIVSPHFEGHGTKIAVELPLADVALDRVGTWG
ncbi:hypothetical protein SZ64_09390 [Erythrobacter sp. SG61-1L]|uniref:ATP-binding protein n=1 Tax=Erythrobacter sp. SG61-1L TaxID=1603897 RepID=UPI0006C91855|nr:ATP-binding protein [Erythrobacter sp. SG61-1L]KPL68314.1 hypothetical protein SZ64_09390 [Erythrobacter sp. SG61-1L]